MISADDCSKLICQLPLLYEEEFTEFVLEEPELIKTAMPHLILVLRRFVMSMRDKEQIDSPDAIELLDAIRWFEANVAE